MSRRLIVVAGIAALGCTEPRDRLDAPRVTLDLDQTSVAAGEYLTGHVHAADRTGVTYVAAELMVNGDSATRKRSRANYIAADSVVFAFALFVASSSVPGSRVVVQATAIDNQLFTVTVEDTIYVR